MKVSVSNAFGIFLIIPLISLSGCDRVPFTKEGQARSRISAMLIDPTSGKFSYTEKTDKAVCGTVNAKNRMGAYTGEVLFIYDTSSGTAELYDGPPDINDYSMWVEHNKDGMTGADEYYNKLQIGCEFPDDWKNKCSPISAQSIPTNDKLCSAWRKSDFSALSQMAHNY